MAPRGDEVRRWLGEEPRTTTMAGTLARRMVAWRGGSLPEVTVEARVRKTAAARGSSRKRAAHPRGVSDDSQKS
jgi:hypothetical protein